MPTPDVRVRLSVEGDAQVMAALRNVAAQAQRTSAETGRAAGGPAKGFAALNSVLAGTRGLLGQLGVAISVGAFVGLARSATETADQLGKMSQRAGASVANMSALAVAARGAGVDLGTLQTSLGMFARKVGELRGGSAESVRAFRALGLSARDFKGKDAAEQFALVAKRLGGMKDSSDKAALAIAIFGRNATQLIPLLNDLAEGGLEAARVKAQKLGLLLSDQMVASVTRVKDDFGDMGAVLQGVALQFVDGLGPAVNQVSEIMQDSAPGIAEGWRTVGRVIGAVLLPVIGFLGAALSTFFTNISALIDWLVTAGRMGLAVLRADYAEADRLWEAQAKRQADRYKQLGQSLKGIWQDLWTAPGAAKLRGGGTDEADITELYRRRQEIIKDALDNELKIAKSRLQIYLNEQKRQYERGLTSVHEYYASRRRAILEGERLELAALRGQLAAELKHPNPDAAQHQKTVTSVRAQIQVKEEGLPNVEAAAREEERQAVQQLYAEWLGDERKLARTQAERHAVAMAEMEREAQLHEETARKLGRSPEQATAEGDRYREIEAARLKYQEALEKSEAAMASYEAERARIESDAQARGLDEVVVKAQLLELERQRLPVLRQNAEAALAAARATRDEKSIAQAQANVDALRNLGKQASTTGQLMRGVISTVADFFASGINQVQNFGDAVRSLGLALAQMIQQLIVQMAQMALLKAIFGAPVGLSGGGQVQKKATGGIVRGPGGPTSDSVPALLSAGEYVVRARAVAMPGVAQLLESMNRGRLSLDPKTLQLLASGSFEEAFRPARIPSFLGVSRFAEGGLVQSPMVAGPRGGRELGGTLTLELPEGARIRDQRVYLESADGARQIIKVISKYRRAIGQALR